jgi:tetratricopeptide (TPR) repeat protein
VGDANVMTHKQEQAERLYSRIDEMNINAGFEEVTGWRRQSLADRITADQWYAVNYYTVDSAMHMISVDTSRIEDFPLSLQYLHALSLNRKGQTQKAASVFENISRKSSILSFQHANAVRAGNAYYRMGEYEEAKKIWWSAKNYCITKAQLIEIDELIELCDYISSKTP